MGAGLVTRPCIKFQSTPVIADERMAGQVLPDVISLEFQSTPVIADERMRVYEGGSIPRAGVFQSTPVIADERMTLPSCKECCLTSFNPRPSLLTSEWSGSSR